MTLKAHACQCSFYPHFYRLYLAFFLLLIIRIHQNQNLFEIMLKEGLIVSWSVFSVSIVLLMCTHNMYKKKNQTLYQYPYKYIKTLIDIVSRASIFLFTRDFRLYDNTALIECCKKNNDVIPLFIFTPEQIIIITINLIMPSNLW